MRSRLSLEWCGTSVLLIQIGNDSCEKAAGFSTCDAAMIERQRQGQTHVNLRACVARNHIALQSSATENGYCGRCHQRRCIATGHHSEVGKRKRVVAHLIWRNGARARALLDVVQ